MKHVYCIEGADNVGKSTLIANMKKEEYCSHYPYKRVVFKKFPTNNVEVYTDIDKMNDIINNSLDDIETKLFWQDKLMEYMLLDMNYIYEEDLMNDCLVISDRGPLSTYLYQYRRRIVDSSSNYNDINVDKELLLLYNFFTHKVPNTSNDINVIVLYNNRKDIELIQDESEEVKFKTQYDNDKKLQEDINKALDNIKKIVKDGFEEVQTKFYFVDIYDKDGNRKTPDDINKEVINIIKEGVV